MEGLTWVFLKMAWKLDSSNYDLKGVVFLRATLPQGDFNFVQRSQWQWNPRGLRKKMSPFVVSDCLRRDDVHQFEAHVFPEAHCALCFWNSTVTVVNGVPPQVTTEALTPSVVRVTYLSSFKRLGIGNSLISLVSLLKCYHKTTRMIDELFRLPQVRLNCENQCCGFGTALYSGLRRTKIRLSKELKTSTGHLWKELHKKRSLEEKQSFIQNKVK
ncbi:hypothetical protein MG293_018715 [Ovis ammon polii]|uniref:Uncharacterized protein n=1 Tax=Ovis ammon polii TaxID=230172 RepID=A0AAD4TQL8_OVIAM|nr:hypothetical protein MG293_018715 [Ovis ammon polii]